MKLNKVNPKDYFEKIEAYLRQCDPTKTYDYLNSRLSCEIPMNQLINRFVLQDKSILSIGPNFGHEEYRFYKAGCKLTFVDLDEANYIEKYLETLEPYTKEDSLDYYLSDANELVSNQTYDVIYLNPRVTDKGNLPGG